MSVYVIECAGLLKIGYSKSPERRTANLFQSTSRYTAPRAAFDARGTQRLLMVINPATKSDEAVIHEALEDYSIGCEWFVDEPAVWNVLHAFTSEDLPERVERPEGSAYDAMPASERGGGNYELCMSVLNKRIAKSAVA